MNEPDSRDAAAADLFEAALGGFSLDEPAEEDLSDRSEALPLVDGYRLVRRLGEGGFGLVYEAEQQSPIRRRVALKILRQGCSTRDLLARFEQERQALALMNHPHIATIHDAGVTGDGRPYIAMELVEGGTIDEAARDLGRRDKIILLRDVALAVAHAHHRGVIHRDLKPSNLLVRRGDDGRLSPKVIDFGIAKALDGPLVTGVIYTQIRQVVGTPPYLSPERLASSQNHSAADTRADVYAIGAILCELLTGEPPRQEDSGGETRVVLPSRKDLPADLRWILEKATDADLSRRYATAGAFAEDLDAWLEGRPPQAGPRGTAYLLRKWVSRHRLAAALGASLAMALIVFVAVLLRQNAETQKALAESEQRRIERDRAASNEHYASAVMRERRRPAHALANLADALRRDPENAAALGLALSTLRHHPFPKPVAPAMDIPGDELGSLAVSSDGSRAATFTTDPGPGRGWILTRYEKGMTEGESTPLPTGAANSALAISNEGTVAWIEADGAVRLWRGDDSITTAGDGIEGARALAWTSRGHLWVIGAKAAVRCDAEGNPLASLQSLPAPPQPIAFSPAAEAVALGLGGGRILVLRDDESPPREHLASLPAPVSALALDESGETVAAAWRNGSLWLSDGTAMESPGGEPVLSLRFLPESGWLLALSPASMRLIDPTNPSAANKVTLTKPLRLVVPLAGRLLLTQSHHDRPALRRLDSLGEAEELPAVEGRVKCVAPASGDLLVLADEEHRRLEWLSAEPSDRGFRRLAEPSDWMAVSAGGERGRFTGIDREGWVRTMTGDGERGTPWRSSEGPLRLAAVDAAGSVALVDLAPAPGVFVSRAGSGPGPLLDWGKASALALSPDGRFAAMGFPSGATAVMDVLSGERLAFREWKRGPVTSLCFIGTDRIALAASSQVRAWDWRGNTVLPTPIDLAGTLTALAPCPDGHRLAAASEGALHVIDIASGRRIVGQLQGPENPRNLLWSHDGGILRVFHEGGAWEVEMPPLVDHAPDWLAGWIEERIGVRIDGEARLVRTGSDRLPTLPGSADPALRRWLGSLELRSE
jgi:WD40 repeat protein